MRIADPPLPLDRIAEFTKAGHWRDTTSNDELERQAKQNPEKIAIVDPRGRLTYTEYYRRAQRLAAHFIGLGLTPDDVIAIQLPNWSEFVIAINAAMLAGVPFCQFHSDFRSREVEFILRFTEASALIVPRDFRGFDYLEMVAELRPKLPRLKHVLVVGDDVPAALSDLRAFLEAAEKSDLSDEQLRRRRPHPNSFMRTAFTSGTTGDPKAVLHLHNTTNCAGWFLNKGQRITSDSVLLVFLPVGTRIGASSTFCRPCSRVARWCFRISFAPRRRSPSSSASGSRTSAARRRILSRFSTCRTSNSAT